MRGDADRIREALRRCVVDPARDRGEKELVISAAYAHAIGAPGNHQYQFPNVCQVLRGRKFRAENRLELLGHTEPCPSSTTKFHYRIIYELPPQIPDADA